MAVCSRMAASRPWTGSTEGVAALCYHDDPKGSLSVKVAGHLRNQEPCAGNRVPETVHRANEHGTVCRKPCTGPARNRVAETVHRANEQHL